MFVLLDEWQTVDPDQILHNVVSDQGLHCLLRPGFYSIDSFLYLHNIYVVNIHAFSHLFMGK